MAFNDASGRTPVPARTVIPKGTKFATYRKNVKMSAGQRIGFQAGKGYYAQGRPVGQGEDKNSPPFTRPVSTKANSSAVAAVTKLLGQPPKTKPKPKGPVLSPAEQQADAALKPLYAGQTAEAKAQNDAIRNFSIAAMQALGQIPGQIQNDYATQIGQQQGLMGQALASIQGANPNAQDQALLQAIGAPQSQQDALAQGNSNAFNLAGATGSYIDSLPLGALRAQGLASTTLARLAPGNQALRAQQALAGALYQQRQDKSKIDAQRPDLVLKYQQAADDRANAAATQSARQQQLQLERDALRRRDRNDAFGRSATIERLRQGDRRLTQSDRRIRSQQDQFIKTYNQRAATFNAKQAVAENKLKLPSASLSRARGYLVDASGNPIPGSNGKKQILPGFKTNAQGRVVKATSPAAGKPVKPYADLTKTQVVTLRATANELRFGTKDKDGNPKPPMLYPAAIQFLVGHGYSRKDAITMLNRFYPPGKAGRPSRVARKRVAADNAAARKGKDATGLGIQIQTP